MSPAAPGPRTQPADAWLRDLVPMRPQGPVELIDRATQVVRTKLADLLVISVGVNVPTWLLLAVVLRTAWARGLDRNAQWVAAGYLPEPLLLLTSTARSAGGPVGIILGRALPSMALTVSGAAAGVLVASWSGGRSMTGGQALGRVMRRGHHLLALWAVVHLLELVTVMGVVLGPLVLGIAAPLWGMELAGVRAVVTRSWRLSTAHLGRVLITVALATVLAILIGGLIGGLASLIVAGLTTNWVDLGGTTAVALGGALPHLVMDPILGMAMALLALDLRVRVEAVDLEVELQELSRAPS